MAYEDMVCNQVYHGALKYGEIIECRKFGRHWKHESWDRRLQWHGPKLTEEELAEAHRIRLMGGKDPVKFQHWLEETQLKIGELRAN